MAISPVRARVNVNLFRRPAFLRVGRFGGMVMAGALFLSGCRECNSPDKSTPYRVPQKEPAALSSEAPREKPAVLREEDTKIRDEVPREEPAAIEKEEEPSRDERPELDVEPGLNTEGTKEITDLRPDELDAANDICRKVMAEFFGESIIAWHKTTYHYLPTSDDGESRALSGMKRLSSPVGVFSVTGIGFSYKAEEIRGNLKREINKMAAQDSVTGKKYHIEECLVIIEHGGGSIGAIHDKVTVIPYRVRVF